jgi:hypothetical protein
MLSPLLLILFLSCFCFCFCWFVVSHLLPATDICVTALSVAEAAVLGAIILRVETEMVATTTTMVTTNETCHSAPSIPLSHPCLREGEGKGNEGAGGGGCREKAVVKTPLLQLPSTATATVNNATIGAISSIPPPPPSTMTAIAAVDNRHCRCHTVNDDNCQKPVVDVCH